MVNDNEAKIVKKYTDQGYSYVHSGAPDFIFYKIKLGTTKRVEDIDLASVEFNEVKTKQDILSHEQQIWRHILKGLGLKYKLSIVEEEQI